MEQPIYNVITWSFNRDSMEYYDIMPYLIGVYNKLKEKDKPSTIEEVKKFIINESRYMYWSRCEYEVIIHGWPAGKNDKKIDVFDQIESNIDVISNLFYTYIQSKLKPLVFVNYKDKKIAVNKKDKFYYADGDPWYIVDIVEDDGYYFLIKSWAKYKNRWTYKVEDAFSFFYMLEFLDQLKECKDKTYKIKANKKN